MTTKGEIQALLRFLSQDAKVPLPLAMGRVKDLQSAHMTSVESIAKTDLPSVQAIFTEEKLAKQVFSAARRVSKKRSAGDDVSSSPSKRTKPVDPLEQLTPAAVEASLVLPSSNDDEQDIAETVLYTNRAPLVLAFAVTLLKYTMPEQPLSSRLSLAQAVVSVNSKSKAISIGIETGRMAEDEGWGQGQPVAKVMGRDIRVMKRWGYEWQEMTTSELVKTEDEESAESQETLKQCDLTEEEPALWGLDLEALRSSNGPLHSGAQGANGHGLPIYNAQSARAYLIKSFASAPSINNEVSPKKKTAAAIKTEKGLNLAKLLQALDLLYCLWAHVLDSTELDRRAWTWYVAVRPEVQSGVAGWGGKGEVKLAQILEMRRKG